MIGKGRMNRLGNRKEIRDSIFLRVTYLERDHAQEQGEGQREKERERISSRHPAIMT